MRSSEVVSLGRIGGSSGDARDPPNIPDIIRAVSGTRVVRFHGFALDSGRRLLSRGARAVHLTRKAFDLLVLLIEQAPRVVTKDELHRLLWPGTFVSDVTLAGVVKEIRAAFRDHDCREPLIHTAHGVGYAFAGVVDRDATPGRADGRFYLVAGSRRLALDEGANDIGRHPSVAVWLDSPQASRRHARITIAGDTVTLEDLGSKNCTLLNDRRVTEPFRLSDGDTIQIGSTVFVFRVVEVTASTETAAGAARD